MIIIQLIWIEYMYYQNYLLDINKLYISDLFNVPQNKNKANHKM